MAVIGIDLGTTNSLVVAFQNGKEVLIPNTMNEYLTPSVVSLNENNEFIVGKAARERLISHPKHTASLFKRKMGTKDKIILGKNIYTPEELSAIVVKQLVEDAKNYLNEEIEEIVISVPAYFDSKQRYATKKIGELLGIKVERLINEPSAASVVCHNGDDFETFVVFDFGGGTLDVSVVDCFDNVVGVCSIAGDNNLGGSDFDKIIALDFCEEHNINFSELPIFKQESLLRIAEKVKLELQENEEVLMSAIWNEQEYKSIYTQERLYEQSNVIFSKIRKIIGKAVRDSGFSGEELDSLILVGGSSNMTIIQKYLKDLLNIPVLYTGDVDTLVARGLGKYIGIKQRDETIKDLVVSDVCPFSLSTATSNITDANNPYASVIIAKNTTLPCSKESSFSTSQLGQTKIKVGVYQGESIYANENLLLGESEIKIPKNLKDYERIIVTYSYDINSMLYVEVYILSNKQKYTFCVGEGLELESTQNIKTLNAIKEVSIKINKEPELELLRARIKRIAMEMDKNTVQYFQNFIDIMEKNFNDNVNSIRKRIEMIEKYNNALDQFEQELNVDNLDIFQKEDADEWLS